MPGDEKENSIFFNHSFDKKRLKAVISWVFKKSGEAEALRVLDLLKEIGFRHATKAGISIGLHDLTTPATKSWLISESQQSMNTAYRDFIGAKITATERSQRIIDTWHRASESLSKQVVDYFGIYDTFNPVYIMALSGARGNFSQVRQLIGMRGLMADQQGKIVNFPIRSNLREGLTITEYFISCSGARKGLVDTALRTADTGYLTRRLVDVSHHVVVKRIRCNTDRGIAFKNLQSYNKILLSLKERLIGRVLAESIVLKNNLVLKKDREISSSLALEITRHRDQVLIRSPLTCGFTHEVCQLCYGWSISQGTLVSLGDAVGVIAAQSIGEPGTQLTMRTFHTGGVFSGDLLQEVRAPHAGRIEFSKAFQGLLIRTGHGRIAFLSKTSGSLILSNSQENNLGMRLAKQSFTSNAPCKAPLCKDCFALHTKRSFVRRRIPCKAPLCKECAMQSSALQGMRLLTNPKGKQSFVCKAKHSFLQTRRGSRALYAKQSKPLQTLSKLRFAGGSRALHGVLRTKRSFVRRCNAYKAPLCMQSKSNIVKNVLPTSKNKRLANKESDFTHIPIQPFTMLFVRQGEKVEMNQLLAEFSIQRKEGNQPIKTEQILFAELSGKVIEDCSGKTYIKYLKESSLLLDTLRDYMSYWTRHNEITYEQTSFTDLPDNDDVTLNASLQTQFLPTTINKITPSSETFPIISLEAKIFSSNFSKKRKQQFLKTVCNNKVRKPRMQNICKTQLLISNKSEELENDLFRYIEPVQSGRLGFLKILSTRIGANFDYISPIKPQNFDKFLQNSFFSHAFHSNVQSSMHQKYKRESTLEKSDFLPCFTMLLQTRRRSGGLYKVSKKAEQFKHESNTCMQFENLRHISRFQFIKQRKTINDKIWTYNRFVNQAKNVLQEQNRLVRELKEGKSRISTIKYLHPEFVRDHCFSLQTIAEYGDIVDENYKNKVFQENLKKGY